jgi:hypothetical protein
MKSKLIKCPDCQGSGKRECPVCYGYGTWEPVVFLFGNSGMRLCTYCKGLKKTDCQTCRRKGKLTQEQLDETIMLDQAITNVKLIARKREKDQYQKDLSEYESLPFYKRWCTDRPILKVSNYYNYSLQGVEDEMQRLKAEQKKPRPKKGKIQ